MQAFGTDKWLQNIFEPNMCHQFTFKFNLFESNPNYFLWQTNKQISHEYISAKGVVFANLHGSEIKRGSHKSTTD